MADTRILNPAGRGADQFRNLAGATFPSRFKTVQGQDYTVEDDVATVAGNTNYGPVTVYLPRAAAHPGRTVVIRKTDAGAEALKIKSAGNETVGGSSWLTLVASGEFAQFQSDGSQWQVVLHFGATT